MIIYFIIKLIIIIITASWAFVSLTALGCLVCLSIPGCFHQYHNWCIQAILISTRSPHDIYPCVLIFSSIIQCSMVCDWILSSIILIKHWQKISRSAISRSISAISISSISISAISSISIKTKHHLCPPAWDLQRPCININISNININISNINIKILKYEYQYQQYPQYQYQSIISTTSAHRPGTCSALVSISISAI